MPDPTTAAPVSDIIAQIQEAVRDCDRVVVRGRNTKPALSASPLHMPAHSLEMSSLSGLVEYEPQEYTFTALAGTPVCEIAQLLQANGQYLPFDPVLLEAGATLGGTIAAGLSGSGRLRYGGLRDFILGVRFVDGSGTLLRGGGKVVKNAAGFDFPKLLVGSMGSLGVIVEASFKVFPAPAAYASLYIDYPQLESALQALHMLTRRPVDLLALDLLPSDSRRGWTLALRIGGDEMLLDTRLARLRRLLDGGDALRGDEEAAFWHASAEFTWAPADAALIKIPLTPAHIAPLEAALNPNQAPRRYAVAGNVLWLAWRDPLDALGATLRGLELPGLVIRGPASAPWLGRVPDSVFARRIKAALDPFGKFPPLFPE